MFWRPGCPYCAALRAGLAREDVAATWRDIWLDEDAAAIVRQVNHGNETVPTVRVGASYLTNPSAREVRELSSGLRPPPPTLGGVRDDRRRPPRRYESRLRFG